MFAEDEQAELQETVGLRERPSKRNRERRDALENNKRRRRRGSFSRDRGEEESAEESAENDEEDDYEADGAGPANRTPSPSTAASSSSPLNYSGHRRNYLPASRVTKQSTSLKVSGEMIGFAVPRKARSGTETEHSGVAPPLSLLFQLFMESTWL